MQGPQLIDLWFCFLENLETCELVSVSTDCSKFFSFFAFWVLKMSQLKNQGEKLKTAALSTKTSQLIDGKALKRQKEVRIGLLGASGYTGAEVCVFCLKMVKS